MKNLFKILIPLSLVFGACSNVYTDKSFFSNNNLNGQTLAVLPVEVVFSGNLPRSWNSARLEKERYERSVAFQDAVYQDLLFKASRKPKAGKAHVKLMDPRVVNEKLFAKGFNPQDTWDVSSADLAGILGVDMVIRGRVENVRYMSQAAAIGINTGASVLEGILNKGNTESPTVGVPRAVSSESDMDLALYHVSRESAVARVVDPERLNVRKLPVYVMN